MSEPRETERQVLPRIAVVNYHHVHDGPDDFFRARPELLRSQMEMLLADGYVPTTPDRLVELKGQTASDERHVLVSFDDAYEDFLLFAWPILRQLGIPATLFVIVDAIGGTNSWDEIRWDEHHHLDLDQLRQLCAEGVVIGSHSRSHRPLIRLDDAELEGELRGSREDLEDLLGVAVPTLAYPGGAVDSRIRQATRRFYELGFATDVEGDDPFCDPYLIPRFDPCFFADPQAFRQQLSRFSGVTEGFHGAPRAIE